jgi:hypothetical protein
MGTNHYLHAPACPCCGKEAEERIHLGKSSGGWCYSLHVCPEEDIYNYQDILVMIDEKMSNGWKVKNEYGETLSLNDWQEIVTKRQGRKITPDHWSWSWYWKNSACPGPCNLARHLLDHTHCIGHGEGTYDYIVGDFS